VPYVLSFTKQVHVTDPDQYINTCCYGGDIVSDRLLPSIRKRYEAIQANQEDWGWFIWFRSGAVRLAIDIFCDDPEVGAFRMHLTSRTPRFLLGDSVIDTPDLQDVKQLVSDEITNWVGSRPKCEPVDADYLPRSGAA